MNLADNIIQNVAIETPHLETRLVTVDTTSDTEERLIVNNETCTSMPFHGDLINVQMINFIVF